MSYVRAWIHLVWATKNRYSFLRDEIRQQVFEHIASNAKTKDIYLDCIGGYTDHLHVLVSLSAEQPIAKVVQLIKGESSFWINKQKLTTQRFEWQEDYFAVSVSESLVGAVRNYIDTQEEHHKKKTFTQEYEEFMERYKFEGLG